MALVDVDYRFIWASVGALGNKHNSTLLRSTDLWKRIVGGGMIPNVVQKVEDVKIPPLLLGDVAFLLGTLILEPCGDAILPDDKQYFNYKNSFRRSIRTIENQVHSSFY